MIPMSDAWIAALSALGSGLLSLLGAYLANRKSAALVEYRLKKLEEKVDKHNNLVERTYILEGQMIEAQHDIRDLKVRKSE